MMAPESTTRCMSFPPILPEDAGFRLGLRLLGLALFVPPDSYGGGGGTADSRLEEPPVESLEGFLPLLHETGVTAGVVEGEEGDFEEASSLGTAGGFPLITVRGVG